MRISNNLMAYNAQNKLSVNNNSIANSVRKLSSGLRISRAGDDAAGLAISEKMRAQIRGLDQASRNSQDAISLIQTAEGALNQTHDILQRMRELAVQAATDTNDGDNATDRTALNTEFQQLRQEIDEIATDTRFNNKQLLTGDFGSQISIAGTGAISEATDSVTSIEISGFAANERVTLSLDGTSDEFLATDASGNVAYATGTDGTGTGGDVLTFAFAEKSITITVDNEAAFVADYGAGTLDVAVSGTAAKIQTGSNAGEELDLSIASMQSTDIGTGAGSQISDANVLTQATASAAISIVNDAINDVSEERSKLGAYQNRLEYKIKNLDTSSENLQSAESRIRDLDMAKEMTEFTSANILSQAATSMLAQANALPQGVLKLLG